MLTAILTDIHANREALDACLAHARRAGAERFVILGDIVGYGADPEYTTDTVMDLAAKGAVVLLGNHDEAVALETPRMNPLARAAILWTQTRLSAVQRDFLTALPLLHREEGRLFVHANAASPGGWGYIDGTMAAEFSMHVAPDHAIFCGHIHVPAIYHAAPMRPPVQFTPVAGVAVTLTAQRRWLCVVGACGQPRDGNPAACYALLDTETNNLTMQRVAYDVGNAARKISEAGLPIDLARRLIAGT